MGIADGQVVGTAVIVNNGPVSQRWNLVIVAEGYRDIELAQFDIDANDCAQTLLHTPPFDTLASGINIHRVDVASDESGADDPIACGGTGAVRRTYFDASFCNSGIRRLLTVDSTLVIQTVSALVPQWNAICVIVNSLIYGGSGGAIAVISKDPSANEIALHELGHSPFGLADEYPCYACTAQEEQSGTQNHHPPADPIEPNVTTNANPLTIKWHSLVSTGTPLPTTQNANCATVDPQFSPVPAGTVGAFEGASYFHCGCYRPEFNCRMRQLGVPYCAVCRNRIATQIAPHLPAPLTSLLRQEEIEVAAYFIWEREGKPANRALNHWLAATTQVWQRHFGVP